MVEKIIHQIWVGTFKIPLREKQYVQSIKSLNPNIEHILWGDIDNEMPDNLKKWYNKFYNIKNYAFCADILRIWVVYKYGGIYLDVDFNISKPLDNIFCSNGTLFYHNDTDFTIPNNIFAFKKESSILEYCINSINEDNSWYGPSWFGSIIKKYLGIEYASDQSTVMNKLYDYGILYKIYYQFELTYGKHMSLYSWSPEIWNRLNDNEQL
jgi:mannosyltransferase OCH1-like enzyme